MTAAAAQVVAAGRRLQRVERVRPLYVLSALVVVDWLTILAVALTVRHNGWLYYQGTDQLPHYLTAWLLAHGHLAHTPVGYAWAIVLLPFALLGGPNLMEPLPFVVLLNVLVLMPIALASVYGIGRRIGGRLFGYWTAALWILVPLVGIKYADAGYHQRYTEFLLPQSLGLTASSAFPSLVALAAAAYFVVRAVQEDDAFDAVFAGLLAGLALAIDPPNAPFLAGAGLALLVARRWSALVRFGLAVLPFFLVLLVWTGHGVDLHPHVDASWHTLTGQFAGLQENFWSARVAEWLPVGGAVALLRRSRPVAALVAGWFACVIVVTWANARGGDIYSTSVLQHTIPAIPAALLLLAAIPLLAPGLPHRLPAPERDGAWGAPRLRLGLAGAAVALFVLLPLALSQLLPQLGANETVAFALAAEPGFQGAPAAPVDSSWHPTIRRANGTVTVSWPALRPLGGAMSYLLLRSGGNDATPECTPAPGGPECALLGTILGPTSLTSFVDHPAAGAWTYRVAGIASWIRDPAQGTVYVLGRPVAVSAG
ncbi:MAG TPA: hypothetical protein VN770_11465 [Gaiellaceae bacterium]|nr:hypothetical protein [Gaiellaceae bacterium]